MSIALPSGGAHTARRPIPPADGQASVTTRTAPRWYTFSLLDAVGRVCGRGRVFSFSDTSAVRAATMLLAGPWAVRLDGPAPD